ncbi:HAMP domain-containing histidine kinase [Candidatus Parcubacteria bacterium]|nr:HAMP domain-containing histidine kinase [Candidatus Parcubacteria bacterium]
MKLLNTDKYESNNWVIAARWFYAPAIFIIGLLSKLDPVGNTYFPIPLMFTLFFSFILMNALFLKFTRMIRENRRYEYVNLLGIGQILAELIFFAVIMHLSGGGDSVSPIFFFIPIVTSIILLDVLGALIVALLATFLVNGTVFLEYYGYLSQIYGYTARTAEGFEHFLTTLTRTVTITAVYFIVAALSGYVSTIIRKREDVLDDRRKKAQFQAEKLRLLNDEYNRFARMLVKRDFKLIKANEKLSELDKAKSEFVSVVAHQLRTPLSAIKWTLNLLIQEDAGPLQNEQKVLLMKAYESNERILNLINEMLGVDKIESGKIDFTYLEIQISDLVQNVVSEMRSQIERKRLKLELDIQKDLPKVFVDPQKMRAVFQNLLENSIKYTKSGGIIKMSLKQDGNALKVSIEDNGIGIPVEQQSNIFNRFFRAKNAIKIENDGSGLGLFIVKAIIERHGGTIDFESAENVGTKFHVTLPLQQQPQKLTTTTN